MNRVFFRAEDAPLPTWTKQAGAFVKKVLKLLGHTNWEVSVLCCSNRYIKLLNAQYRGKDEPTDVLAFPLGDGDAPHAGTDAVADAGAECYVAGDIVISLDGLEENARFFNVSAEQELRRLLIHALLHLAGEDHASNDAEEPMLKHQEEILAHFSGERIHMEEYVYDKQTQENST
ncbi:MAG: rRNA maturation RNase YbeY [Treponema sp.]|nr:rRNA maturation RNase YbeY [Treponema sp.]